MINTKTMIPITKVLKRHLRKQCRVEGRTYDSLITEMLAEYLNPNIKKGDYE